MLVNDTQMLNCLFGGFYVPRVILSGQSGFLGQPDPLSMVYTTSQVRSWEQNILLEEVEEEQRSVTYPMK